MQLPPFEAIGTTWIIDVYETNAPSKPPLDEAFMLNALKARIDNFDAQYSRFRGDSLVTKMSHEAGNYTVQSDAEPLFELYKTLYELTEGAFTPLIGKTMEQAGYDANYSLKPKIITPVCKWEEVMRYEFPYLNILQPVLLDFGAAGKGYLVDIIASVLINIFQCTSFCIDAGGDIVYRRSTGETLEVGLENPHDANQVIGISTISDGQSLCASSGNRRMWAGYHHIMNPHTLRSVENVVATWVVASSGLVADGIATALFFTAPEKLLSAYAFSCVILYKDGSAVVSPDFPGILF